MSRIARENPGNWEEVIEHMQDVGRLAFIHVDVKEDMKNRPLKTKEEEVDG